MPLPEGTLTYEDLPVSRYADQDRCSWVTHHTKAGAERICRNAGYLPHRGNKYAGFTRCECGQTVCKRHRDESHPRVDSIAK